MLILLRYTAGFAQQDSTIVQHPDTAKQKDSAAPKQSNSTIAVQTPYIDSLLRDSVKNADRQQFLADSFAMIYLKVDSNRKNNVVNNIFRAGLSYDDLQATSRSAQKIALRGGLLRVVRDPWIITALIALFIFTALLNLFFGRDIASVIQSFYSKQAFSQIDFGGGLINSWAFIGLFILFSTAFGLVLYQVAEYNNVYFYYDLSDVQLFLVLSLIIALLFAVKFLILKFLGFVFDINQVVSQYISILNLTYFNIAFVLLAVAACFTLLASRFIPLLLNCTIIVVAIIFIWQYLRNSVSIISNFRFHKFYLFIYLCALEICPILILIKSLNI
ncbi:DUF4271 domain-containing protein [Mucilaginibacter frigoritolerans]|uniref:DUF4271 domain-containing protein n=1 Tax=Mucilaginibacter frigoritolerans TaxID=652788 RepID=UPI001476D986|nr:DUF4271 domain-containing protein [Mucilaginibacter frigoritolerans]